MLTLRFAGSRTAPICRIREPARVYRRYRDKAIAPYAHHFSGSNFNAAELMQ